MCDLAPRFGVFPSSYEIAAKNQRENGTLMMSGTGYHQGAGFSQGSDPSVDFSQTSSCPSLAEAALQARQQMTLLHRWRARRRILTSISVFTPSEYSFHGTQLRFSSGAPGLGGVLCRALISIPCPSSQPPVLGEGVEHRAMSAACSWLSRKIPQQKCIPGASGQPC